MVSTPEVVEEAVRGQGGTGGALQEPCKMTSSRLQLSMCLHKQKQTPQGWYKGTLPKTELVLTAQYCARCLVVAREHQD